MPIAKPSDAPAYFMKAFDAADRQALLNYYSPDAVLSLPGGQQHTGHPAIAQALETFLALKGTMSMEPIYLLENGDTVLLRAKWRLEGKGPDNSPIIMEGSNIEVLQRQPDGNWQCTIDAPFGGN